MSTLTKPIIKTSAWNNFTKISLASVYYSLTTVRPTLRRRCTCKPALAPVVALVVLVLVLVVLHQMMVVVVVVVLVGEGT